MPRAILLPLAVLALSGTALAADLPPQTKLGAVFARPYVAAPPVAEVYDTDYPLFVFAPQVDIPPLVNGYYGKPNSYYYRPYYGSYGGAIGDAYTRLPYACGFYGYC